MKRYAAFLRGVSPMNCKMAELAQALEAAGFEDVKTVLSSGNAVFSFSGAASTVRKKAEASMEEHLGRRFMAFIRPVDALEALLQRDPFAPHRLPADAKRVVTFFQSPPDPAPRLPAQLERARILAMEGHEAFSMYQPQPGNPVFMTLIERTFGKDVTTRTWDTIAKVVKAAR